MTRSYLICDMTHSFLLGDMTHSYVVCDMTDAVDDMTHAECDMAHVCHNTLITHISVTIISDKTVISDDFMS